MASARSSDRSPAAMPWIYGTRMGSSPFSPCCSRPFSRPRRGAARSGALREIEHQQLRGRVRLELDAALLDDGRAVAGFELIAVERNGAAHELHPGTAPGRDRMG